MTKKEEAELREIARMNKECTDAELFKAYRDNLCMLQRPVCVKENRNEQRFGILIQPDGCYRDGLGSFGHKEKFYDAIERFSDKEFMVVPMLDKGKPTCGMKPFVWRGDLGDFKQMWSVD